QYFKNGNLKSTKTYKNDTIQGLEVFYYENGGIKKTGLVVNGRLEGIWKEYTEKGKLIGTCVFKNNEPIKVTKYP
ncbi:MAG: toxin-antitoxin system YwqK family antitoxin, partial [Fluviicola sp.]